MRRGLKRPRYVKVTDQRSAMRRLLEDGQCNMGGFVGVVVSYDQQHRTMWKAQELGYVTKCENQILTDAGRAFLESGK
jgi:hypothetical protein